MSSPSHVPASSSFDLCDTFDTLPRVEWTWNHVDSVMFQTTKEQEERVRTLLGVHGLKVYIQGINPKNTLCRWMIGREERTNRDEELCGEKKNVDLESKIAAIVTHVRFWDSVKRIMPLRDWIDFENFENQLLTLTVLKKYVLRLNVYPNFEKERVKSLLEGQHDLYFCCEHYTHHFCVCLLENKISWDLVPREVVLFNDKSRESVVCRAYYKIQEIFQNYLDIDTRNFIIVDVGASPGGWSQFFSTFKFFGEYYAVDPAEIIVPMSKNMFHLRMRSENAVQFLQNKKIDMLLCDMNLNIVNSMSALSPLFCLLKSGAFLIFTIKYVGWSKKSEQMDKQIENLQRILSTPSQDGTTFENIRILWLLSNTARERTVVCQKS